MEAAAVEGDAIAMDGVVSGVGVRALEDSVGYRVCCFPFVFFSMVFCMSAWDFLFFFKNSDGLFALLFFFQGLKVWEEIRWVLIKVCDQFQKFSDLINKNNDRP